MRDTEGNMLRVICQAVLYRIQQSLRLDSGDHGHRPAHAQDHAGVVLPIKQDVVLTQSKYIKFNIDRE